MKRLWVASYDIADDRRRRRAARVLLARGDRLQESVFECPLRAEQLPALAARLRGLLDAGDDRLALIPVCRDCQRRALGYGLGRRAGIESPRYFCV